MIFFNYIRLILAGLLFTAFALPLIIAFYIKKEYIYKLSSIVGRVVLKTIGIKLSIQGVFPSGGPFIIMFNHTSFIDAFIFPSIVQGKYTGITAKENFKIPVFAQLMTLFNIIPIDRNNTKKAIQSLNLATKYLKKGFHLGLLPEGSRSRDGSLQPFKKGGFHIAVQSRHPILPIGINGAFEYKSKFTYKLKPGKVVIKIGKPINIKKDDSIESVLQKTQKTILNLS